MCITQLHFFPTRKRKGQRPTCVKSRDYIKITLIMKQAQSRFQETSFRCSLPDNSEPKDPDCMWV